MKIIFILCIFIISLQTNIVSQWTTVYNQQYTYPDCVQFLNSETGYCAMALGVRKSTNGGLTWPISITYPTGVYHKWLYFVDEQYGIVVCQDGNYLRTSNGGTNWTLSNHPDSTFFVCVYLVNYMTGWASSVPFNRAGEIVKTTNGGLNWINQISVHNNGFNSIFFHNTFTGWASGWHGNVYKTTNGGINWISYNTGSTKNFMSVFFASLNTGWLTGQDGAIFKSTNGGINWISQQSGGNNYLRKSFFVNEVKGWAVGDYNKIISTTNGGLNWQQQHMGTFDSYFSSVNFINQNTGWVSGDRYILKTTNGGITALEPINNLIPKTFFLSQNYPNPFNPTTKIKFDIPKSSFTKVIIYHLLGMEVTTLVSEELQAGTYEADWDASNFSSGIYFYKLIAGDYAETKKMVLLK